MVEVITTTYIRLLVKHQPHTSFQSIQTYMAFNMLSLSNLNLVLRLIIISQPKNSIADIPKTNLQR